MLLPTAATGRDRKRIALIFAALLILLFTVLAGLGAGRMAIAPSDVLGILV